MLNLKISRQSPGALWLIISLLSTAIGNTFVHQLVQEYTAIQIVFFKSVITFLILFVIQFVRSPKKIMHSEQVNFQILRGCIGFVGVWLWVESIRYWPLADVSAISLSSSLLSAIGGYWIFKEQVTWQKNIALFIGFSGVYFILKPHISISYTIFFPLMSAGAYAVSALIAKHVVKKDNAITTTLYLTLTMTLISGLILGINGSSFNAITDITPLLAIGICYAISQITFVKAYAFAEASFLAPLKFLKFPLHALFGFVFFFEIPTITTLWGTLFIMLGSFLLFYKDGRQK